MNNFSHNFIFAIEAYQFNRTFTRFCGKDECRRNFYETIYNIERSGYYW